MPAADEVLTTTVEVVTVETAAITGWDRGGHDLAGQGHGHSGSCDSRGNASGGEDGREGRFRPRQPTS